MRPLTKVSIGLLIFIAVLLLFYAKMNRDLQRILDERPAVAACLEAGGTAEKCRDAAEGATKTEAEEGGGATKPDSLREVEGE